MTKAGIKVRSATHDDLEQLASLNAIVQAVHASAEPGDFNADVRPNLVQSFFGALMLAPHSFLLLAEIAGSAVGYLWFDVQEREATAFTRARRRLYIHHLVVRDEVRRSGVATALVQACEAEARRKGVRQIALDSWAFNEGAQSFFAARGFVPFNIQSRKELT